MSYKINQQRIDTMLERLGGAVELIDDRRFLPFYRSIQIKLEKMGKPDEWANMIETAKTKTAPSQYFASICKMVKLGTYKFVEKVKEATSTASLYIQDKMVKFGFGKYQKYWVRKAQEFVNVNSMAEFVELLEYAERKNISQKYMATALKNCKGPGKYYKENVLGGAQ